MRVTSRPWPTLPGRRACSSTPRALTPASRTESSARRRASSLSPSHRVCASDPEPVGEGLTVVSSSCCASAAHSTARAVSSARGAADGCLSLQVTTGKDRSRHRQMHFRQRTGPGGVRTTRRTADARARCQQHPVGRDRPPPRAPSYPQETASSHEDTTGPAGRARSTLGSRPGCSARFALTRHQVLAGVAGAAACLPWPCSSRRDRLRAVAAESVKRALSRSGERAAGYVLALVERRLASQVNG